MDQEETSDGIYVCVYINSTYSPFNNLFNEVSLIIVETTDCEKHLVNTFWSVSEVLKKIMEDKPIVLSDGREEAFIKEHVKRISERRNRR